ncbi:MAG: CRISPR-associated protein Csx19 [Phascolarctobacterium sp.]|nr:CRISPR-associated protein Csx19 [Phascolarctobacterium sp.]
MSGEKTEIYLKHNSCSVLKSEAMVEDALQDIIDKYSDGQYKVIIYMMNKLVFARLDFGKLTYPNDVQDFIINEKYFNEMRIFNEHKEIHIKKKKNNYHDGQTKNRFYVTIIVDSADGDNEYVEVHAELFNKAYDQANEKLTIVPKNGFAKLSDYDRKIYLNVPVDGAGPFDKCNLITRSYITYNETTGQAGYGFFRFVDIKGVIKNG